MSTSLHRGALSDPPVLPESRRPQRARVILDFTEHTDTGTEHIHEAATGWAKVDGPWLFWWNDDDEQWQQWPMQHVLVIEWVNPDA